MFNNILGNKYTRDLAENFPTQRDEESKYVRHEITHTRRNYEEFGNVTSNLKQYRKRDPNRIQPWPILNHSAQRRQAQPLGSRESGLKSAGNIKKERVDKDFAYREKVKRTLKMERGRTIKKEVTVELPYENDRGFKLGDYVKGNFDVLTCICGIKYAPFGTKSQAKDNGSLTDSVVIPFVLQKLGLCCIVL